jgi:invasion protein IalB
LLDWRAEHQEGESLKETSGDWRVVCTSVGLDQCILSALFFKPDWGKINQPFLVLLHVEA